MSSRVVLKFKIDFDYKISKDKEKCCKKCTHCYCLNNKYLCKALPANIKGVLDDVEGMIFPVQPNYRCKCLKLK